MEILKEVRFPESLLILLQIRFVWNNGGQKHSLSFDVRCPVSGQFFICLMQNFSPITYPSKGIRWLLCECELVTIAFRFKWKYIQITVWWGLYKLWITGSVLMLCSCFNSKQGNIFRMLRVQLYVSMKRKYRLVY